ncbi:MAG TPA: hypothetical protein VFJ77_09270 [Gaiellaceae bacterium]|nr:hypothetical protein [Gaiellaceae bacterium]
MIDARRVPRLAAVDARRVPRLAAADAGTVLLVALVAAVGWRGMTTAGRDFSLDARAHLEYAQYFSHHFAPPPESQNYEFFNPPLFAMVAIALEAAMRAVPSWGPGLGAAGIVVWLAAVAAGTTAIASARPRIRLLGVVGLALAVLAALDAVLGLGASGDWYSGQVISLAATLGLVAVAVLVGRELWPERPWLALGTGAVVVAYPVVLRLGILFHPEALFALLASLALLLGLRAARTSWSVRRGLGLGVVCGLAALTRASALAAVVALLAVALVAGRRGALGFAVACLGALAVVAGPWWIAAYHLWGNPLESNLDRPGYMLPHGQPLSFYVSAPLRTLVVHPYRPNFENQLLPKLHAELWSDWFGGLTHLWAHPTRLQRVTASTQSVLGFAGDALALAGLALAGIPAVVRLVRLHDRRAVAWAFVTVFCVLAFAAFVATLVRYPQTEGDPIKTSYLLFTAPCWAALAVAAWERLRARIPVVGAAVAAVGVVYAGSYAVTLAGVF